MTHGLYYQIDTETGRQMTCDQVIQTVKDLAAGLQDRFDIEPGKVVGIGLPNCIEYGIVALAANLCGAVAATFSPIQTTCTFVTQVRSSTKI